MRLKESSNPYVEVFLGLDVHCALLFGLLSLTSSIGFASDIWYSCFFVTLFRIKVVKVLSRWFGCFCLVDASSRFWDFDPIWCDPDNWVACWLQVVICCVGLPRMSLLLQCDPSCAGISRVSLIRLLNVFGCRICVISSSTIISALLACWLGGINWGDHFFPKTLLLFWDYLGITHLWTVSEVLDSVAHNVWCSQHAPPMAVSSLSAAGGGALEITWAALS